VPVQAEAALLKLQQDTIAAKEVLQRVEQQKIGAMEQMVVERNKLQQLVAHRQAEEVRLDRERSI
jgi:hypothetical protein